MQVQRGTRLRGDRGCKVRYISNEPSKGYSSLVGSVENDGGMVRYMNGVGTSQVRPRVRAGVLSLHQYLLTVGYFFHLLSRLNA